MHILITNDDGINSYGIGALVKELSKEHQLTVIAPDRERSATGHALTLHKPLRVKLFDIGIPNTTAYHTTGTPTDCVKLAICSLLENDKIDLIITGINHGPNLGADILYSGTVNAAIEGAIYSIPSIAISLTKGDDDPTNFVRAAQFLGMFLKKLPEIKIPDNTVLNINYPPGIEPDLSLVRITELGKRMYCDYYERREDPRGRIYYWLSGEPIEDGEAPESDVMAVKDGLVSVTPVHFNLTDKTLITSLKKYFS